MKVTADTSVLVRAVVLDDPAQAAAVNQLLQQATLIAVSLPCLCEFVWVLRRVYGFDAAACAAAIHALLAANNVVMNRPAVEAGLTLLQAGGDFADGIMAHEGKWLGGKTFVSFDRQAVKLLAAQGEATRLLP